MKTNWIKGFWVIGILSVLSLMLATAQAQEGSGGTQADYSDKDIKSFIIANVGIYQLQQQVASQMSNIESDEQKQELIQTANHQVDQVLQNAGLTLDEYNAMGKNIQADVQLQEKINAMATELFEQEEQEK